MTDRFLSPIARSRRYEQLGLRLVYELDGGDAHPLSEHLDKDEFDVERDEQRVAIAVCRAAGMTPERWDKLDPFSREPYVELALAGFARLPDEGDECPPTDDQTDVATEPNGTDEPRAASRLVVDEPCRAVVVDGTRYDVSSPAALRWVRVLAAPVGEWVSGADLEERERQVIGPTDVPLLTGNSRPDKLKKHLPKPVADLITSRTGAGSRLLLDRPKDGRK